MANTRVRRLYGLVSVGGVALATALVSRSGKVVAVEVSVIGTAGAGTDAHGFVEVSKVNQSGIQLNDAQNSIVTLGWSAPVASVAFSANKVVEGIAVDVSAGDYFYLNCYRTGTAPGDALCEVSIYVLES